MTLKETLSQARQDDIIEIDGLDYQVLRVADRVVYLEGYGGRGYGGHTLKATVDREVTIELVSPEVA